MLLSVERLYAGYGLTTVLRDISLDARAGEAVAVIGPNGAGKTTLLKSIVGMLRPTRGRVAFENRQLDGLRAFEVARLGLAYVPAERELFPTMTVIENLELGAYAQKARLTGTAHPHLDKVFDLFPRLAERRSQLAGTMSGGEQQMCAIARTLMSGPKLVLLDEPSMGLAPVIVAQVFDLVKRIRSEGYTVLIVEQNVSQVLKVVDRAYLLEVGRIKASGPAADLAASDDIRKAYMGL